MLHHKDYFEGMHGRDNRLRSLLFFVQFIVYLVVVPGADTIFSNRTWIKLIPKLVLDCK